MNGDWMLSLSSEQLYAMFTIVQQGLLLIIFNFFGIYKLLFLWNKP